MEFTGLQLYLIWLYLTAGIFICGVLVLFLPSVVPSTLIAIYKYGKSADQCKKTFLTSLLSVPKRWFTHFYICACSFHLFLLWSVFTVYWRGQPCPAVLKAIVSILAPKFQFLPVSPASVVVSTALMVLQVFRRLYECFYISVFSSDAKMSLVHYTFGLYFYLAVGCALIVEAPGFANNNVTVLASKDFLNVNCILGAVLFIIGWYIEFNSHSILANLRKDAKGKVIHTRHVIPQGGLFGFVSCPHYFGEVIVYLAIVVVFAGRNITWWTVFLNVLANQIISALMSHLWYQKKFEHYPKERKAIIPFFL